jgi:site-specific DNA-methyltransferase (adenine-specific)
MFVNVEIKQNYKFLDPCCGSGNFIIEAIKTGIAPENAYGFDVDENAVAITKERIRREIGFESPNIIAGDFLNEALKLRRQGKTFDLIFTNPPWGKKISKPDKEKFSALFGCGNSLDTSSLFMNAGFIVLNKCGILGFLIQEAFFNITAFESIRNNVLEKEILRLIDYGKAFKGLLTKAQAIIVLNETCNKDSQIECCYDDVSFYRSSKSFKSNPKRIFNFWTNDEESQVIDRLYSIKHTTLQGKAKWALGIVTGNNDGFCKNTQIEGYIPVYKGSDITRSGLKEAATYIPDNFGKFQQVAPIKMYQAKEKLIYRFIASHLCFFYDDSQRYILNSANLLIPVDVGISAKQLSELLNSEIINWLFQKLFNTHKILRSDLELLPIHIDYFNQYSEFCDESYLEYLQITKTENGTYKPA